MQIVLLSSGGFIDLRFVDVLGEKHNVRILDYFVLQIRTIDKPDYLNGTCWKGVQKKMY